MDLNAYKQAVEVGRGSSTPNCGLIIKLNWYNLKWPNIDQWTELHHS